eukprot:2673164-Amphidinium_carterae.1
MDDAVGDRSFAQSKSTRHGGLGADGGREVQHSRRYRSFRLHAVADRSAERSSSLAEFLATSWDQALSASQTAWETGSGVPHQ